MRMPSANARRLLERATTKYETEIALAGSFLAGRGIDPETAAAWRLGVVHSPEPGHEQAVGRLSIPYQNKLGVVGLKFRCLQDHDCKADKCAKYIQPSGQSVFMFNVLDTDTSGRTIHVCEGETDTIILKQAF